MDPLPIKQLSKYTWEIPKNAQDGMRVPGRIFANEQLIKKMQTDATLRQCANVASLPGIYKYSIALPDAHSGYGFPIGGVAAIDTEEGVISPGGIGYDINCLCKGTKILSSLGYWKEIEDYERMSNLDVNQNFDGWLVSLNVKANTVRTIRNNKLSSSPINAFLKKKPTNQILKIVTKTGLKILCSEDHPLRTDQGFIKASALSEDNHLSVLYFTGCHYEPLSTKIIYSESEEKDGIIAKLFGYLLGDGSVTKSGNKLHASFFGTKIDLQSIQKDIKKIGYFSRIFTRARKGRIKSQYGIKEFQSISNELHVYSQEFSKLMISLGMPLGKKPNQEFLLPEWLMQSPKWIKRLFLAGFFGAELSSPKSVSKTCFNIPTFCQNKNTYLIENGRAFFLQIVQLLKQFNIEVSKIAERKEYPNKSGPVTRLRLLISSNEDNLLRLWQTIGYEYNQKRSNLAEIAVQYILLKKQLTKRRYAIRKRIQELKKMGFRLKELMKIFRNDDINERFIERSYYEKKPTRISQSFQGFEDFKEIKLNEINSYGTLLDKIEKISVINYTDYVYDFNITDTHNFIANNIIVSNCGVRLLRTNLTIDDARPKIKALVQALFTNVPSGLGSKGKVRVSPSEVNQILEDGSEWAVDQGYGWTNDLKVTEEKGRFEDARSDLVSERAKQRGKSQVGSLGSGNHFLEIQVVDKILNPEKAKAMGVENEGQIMTMIHTGSRGLGHQVCSDYLKIMEVARRKYGLDKVVRELSCAPINSKEGEKYYSAMAAGANFAWCNRQMIMHWVRQAFSSVFKQNPEDLDMHLIYDVAHNIGKKEIHEIEGKKRSVLVHRKGATRAFPPGHAAVPAQYRAIGQPVLIPGSMGTSSYVLTGTENAMQLTFGSTAHGAGRMLSRTKAKKRFWGGDVQKKLASQGINVQAASKVVLAEEADGAYKDIESVVGVSHELGIATKVIRLKPLGVTKG